MPDSNSEFSCDPSVRFPAPHPHRVRRRCARSPRELARELDFVTRCSSRIPGSSPRVTSRAGGRSLQAAGMAVTGFHDFDANPDTHMVEAGRACRGGVAGRLARRARRRQLARLREGHQLRPRPTAARCATTAAIGKARGRLLPSIGVPTTAGTGSEAQSYAIISDAETHAKMACGDPEAAFRVAILDPALTVSQPRTVTAIAGYDAISHAVESYVTTKRTPVSDLFARDAWRLLESRTTSGCSRRRPIRRAGRMLLGAHEAGIAIEQSMLGATHACANPLTARYGTTHGDRHRRHAAPRRAVERGGGWRALRGAGWRSRRDGARRADCPRSSTVSRVRAGCRRPFASSAPLARGSPVAGRRCREAMDRHIQPAAVRRCRRPGAVRESLLTVTRDGNYEFRIRN